MSLHELSDYPTIKNAGNIVVHRPFAEALAMEKSSIDFERRAKEFFEKNGFPLLGGSAAGPWTFTNSARTKLLNGQFDLDSDSFKMALFLSTSNLGTGSTTYAGVTNEHANANGYTTGGIAVTLTLSGTTTVTVDVSSDPIWTASGGSITARFAAIYEVGGDILCYCLLDSTPADVTATTGNTLKVEINSSGVFTLA
jgi:hypothetical protein